MADSLWRSLISLQWCQSIQRPLVRDAQFLWAPINNDNPPTRPTPKARNALEFRLERTKSQSAVGGAKLQVGWELAANLGPDTSTSGHAPILVWVNQNLQQRNKTQVCTDIGTHQKGYPPKGHP